MEPSNTSHFKLSATSCGACAVHFDSAETRRAHAKSQWHVANLRRRVAELEPLTAEQHAALSRTTAAPAGGPAPEFDAEDSSSSLSGTNASHDEPDDDDDDNSFAPEICLFCNARSGSFDDNLVHMGKAHGMFIPSREKLVVDLETLVRYLHLVVFGYRECLECGTQRRTAAAAQQHMLGKGHCKFDIAARDSEFRDFYEDAPGASDGGGDDDDDDDDDDGEETRKAIADALEEGGPVRLPSGKTLAHRSAPAPSRQRTKPGPSGGCRSDNLLPEGGPRAADATALAPPARAERRGAVFETQLARLGAGDRAALAHLPPAEQRSVLLTQKRQLDRADKAARRLQTRLQMKANKTAQGHFVNDVPGRANG
ncbi:hypothetical protein LX32DRAFT_98031 [Colletotrichum zoysiae]|uniref:ZN622/Rei1/Reh1 zinc finger C2H2-type domain-containing protein n=1 Tax=Colletotrichum zoysiae TaxID=1216348 RepID=A0AAD9HAE7_9PEZI|nr:hypothetical protein LX32DRAFT_98031 [Colletotrichum zoysiae]